MERESSVISVLSQFTEEDLKDLHNLDRRVRVRNLLKQLVEAELFRRDSQTQLTNRPI